ncbi:MAG TPA: hypothetical protein VIT42_09610 [Microlunatus sp.]
MKIDWAALGIVAVTSVVATVLFMLLLASGIRLVSASTVRTSNGHSSGLASRTAGIALLGCAGLLVLLGIYLILPFSS